MKLIVNDKDLSQIYKSIQWSGDKKQRARSLSVSCLYKKGSGIPEVSIKNGDTIALYDDSQAQRFLGIVTQVQTSMAGVTVQVNARDILWYLGRNQVAKVYKGTADAILKGVWGILTLRSENFRRCRGRKP